MLGVMLAAAPAAQAGTITYGDLVRTVGAGGQLRPAGGLRVSAQAAQQQGSSTQSGAASSGQQPSTGTQEQTGTAGSGQVGAPASADPTISQSGGRVETVDLGDVTGTVCDCGVIPSTPGELPKGGFPWWTLAGIPLICVSGICTGDNPQPPDNPPGTPKPPEIPEPMSLLLFGSGLLAVGAGARRRRARRLEEEVLNATTTEEV